MEFQIAVLGGDGIGPEVTGQAVRVLQELETLSGHRFNLAYGDVGGVSIDQHGIALQPEVADLAAGADAVLFGASAAPSGMTPPLPCAPKTLYSS